jgi:hypothetical protein
MFKNSKTLFVPLLAVVLFVGQQLSAQQQQGSLNFPLSKHATKILVDSLSNQICKYYIEKDAAEKIAADLKKNLKQGTYDKINDPHALAAKLTSDVLAVHGDEHFHIEYNPVLANEVSGNIEDVPKMVAEKLKVEKNKNFGFRKVEVLNGNIGYLEISAFSRLNAYSKAAADAALKFISNSDAVIIDLRYGVGGSPDMVTHLLGHFFAERTHITDIYIRCENATLPYYTSPDTTTPDLTRVPIYVLTSYKTFSAAEGLTYALQSLKRATIIGEVTRGGAHTVTYRPLSAGFVADIPFGHAIDPRTKTNWEAVGIMPDIRVSADEALESAEKLIFEERLKLTKDSIEYAKIKWQRDFLLAANHPTSLSSAELQAVEGKYGAFTLTLKNNQLYYQKTGKAKFPLIALSATQFRPRGNDTFIISIKTAANGDIAEMTTAYDDGRIETAQKTK